MQQTIIINLYYNDYYNEETINTCAMLPDGGVLFSC